MCGWHSVHWASILCVLSYSPGNLQPNESAIDCSAWQNHYEEVYRTQLTKASYLYGIFCVPTSVVLGEGQDILELIGEEKEDPRLQYGTRKYSVVRNGDDENPLPDGAW